MTVIAEHDIVKVLETEGHGWIGTVVHMYPSGTSCEVEGKDRYGAGFTKTVPVSRLELLWDTEP